MEKGYTYNSDKTRLYKELITPIYSDLYKFIFSIIRNKSLVDDILQETLLCGYENISKIKDIEKFKSWIFTIAKRKAISAINMSKKEICVEVIEGNSEANMDEYFIDLKYSDAEIKDLLIEIINNMRWEYKNILLLVYYSDLSLLEASRVLDIKYNTAKTWHKRAKDLLRAELEKRIDGDIKELGVVE